MDKLRIAATFAAAARGYDDHAVVQRHAVEHLATQVQTRWPRVQRVVEIGCGTGSLTERLLRTYPNATILASDIAPDMVEVSRQRMMALGASGVQFAVADGEHLDCSQADLVASSLVFQWFSDQSAALRRLSAQVPRLAVATLLDGTFCEWRAVHARLGLDDGVRDFMAEDTLHDLCTSIGAHLLVETVQEHYPEVLQFVRSLKAIGASTARPGHRPTPLRRVLREFPHGITVSYRLAYVLSPRCD